MSSQYVKCDHVSERDTAGGKNMSTGLVEKNRKTLEALVTFLVDQHLIAAPVKVDDLFVPTYG